ncbi:TPR-like protein [Calocera viscosa TUFC12733]|uniref:TPR-like protein n=1 Tax=Calocera viscosa (strain TUFC12733) TaxID=1330018 RepID=A0A167HP21_CALVF|nr:TPR-like protein [Calocera viscosa TUFC12733]
MSVNSSGGSERRANKGKIRRLIPWGRGARDPSDPRATASLPIAGGSQSEYSSAEAQGARLKARLQQWLSDMVVPLDSVKQTVKDTELQTRQKDAKELIGHASWVTDQILAKIQAASVPDEPTQDVTDALSKTISDIKQFLKKRPTVAEYIGTQRAGKFAQFRQQLDTLRIQFLLLIREATCRIPLLGAGGMGKTSVAAAVINDTRIKDKFGENIIFLSCENLVSAEGIISVLAAYFKLPKDSRTLSAVLARLSALDCVLLVLDNLETPLETSDTHRVERFLGKVAEVSCLSLMITMRGTAPPDCVLWEKGYFDPLDRLPLDAGLQIWRSLAGNEDAKLDELLTRLDGLPLAIRLMASQAQLTHMTPTQLLGAYEKEATRLLNNRGSGKLKSLDVSIQLSLECKTMAKEPNALRLLSVLSLLPDGVPLEALPAMVPSVMYTVITCGSVLLQVALAFQENGRLRVLSPIRDFILAEYPPQGTLLEETESYFMTLVRDYEAGAERQKQGVEMISADVDNMRSILIHLWTTAEESKDVKGRLEVTLRISQFPYLSSYGDCVPLLATAEVALQAMGYRLGTAQCTRSHGNVLYMQSRYEEAAEKLREAKAAFQAIGDVLGTAQCTQSLGNVLIAQSRYEEGAERLEEAKVAFKAIGDVLGTAQCTERLGKVLFNQSRYEEAEDKLREAKAEFEAIGDVLGTAQCTRSLGKVLLSQSRHEEAEDKLREAKADFEAIGDVLGTAKCTRSLGGMLLSQSRYEEAADQLREAKAAFQAIGDLHGTAQCTKRLGDVLLSESRYEEATDKLTEGKAIFEAIGNVRNTAQCTLSLGNVLYMQDRYPEAEDKLREAKAAFEAIGNRDGQAWCSKSLGVALHHQGHYDEAGAMLNLGMEIFGSIGDPCGAAECNRSLGEVLCSEGHYEAAMERLTNAKSVFEAVGERFGAAQCARGLGRILCAEKHYEEATERLREAQEVFVALGSRADAAQSSRSLAEVFSAQGKYVEAEATLIEARDIYKYIRLPKRVEECTEALARLRSKMCTADDVGA